MSIIFDECRWKSVLRQVAADGTMHAAMHGRMRRSASMRIRATRPHDSVSRRAWAIDDERLMIRLLSTFAEDMRALELAHELERRPHCGDAESSAVTGGVLK